MQAKAVLARLEEASICQRRWPHRAMRSPLSARVATTLRSSRLSQTQDA
jgi:hypothetical protein